MEKRELICIGCPLGCMLTVEMEGESIINITGNTCPKGKVYAEKEVMSPTRIVTSTVRVSEGEKALVSCKTSRDIPKEKIFAIVSALKDVEVKAPVNIGDILVSDVAGLKADIVATANVAI
jgi:CxxC motif-containing protein